jgi:hypothetical protein
VWFGPFAHKFACSARRMDKPKFRIGNQKYLLVIEGQSDNHLEEQKADQYGPDNKRRIR